MTAADVARICQGVRDTETSRLKQSPRYSVYVCEEIIRELGAALNNVANVAMLEEAEAKTDAVRCR